MQLDTLVFLPLAIPNPPKFIEYWDTISYDDIITDNYRSCYHIPIHVVGEGYTEFAKKTPELICWIDKYIFSFTGPTRIMIITTPPNGINPIHIDCSPKKFNTLQHKIRYVFQGFVSSLEFITETNTIKPHDKDRCFVMDGSWPHSMHNDNNLRKYTLAIGAPWEPSYDDKKYYDLLHQSYKLYADDYISINKNELPVNYKDFFESKYKKDLQQL